MQLINFICINFGLLMFVFTKFVHIYTYIFIFSDITTPT